MEELRTVLPVSLLERVVCAFNKQPAIAEAQSLIHEVSKFVNGTLAVDISKTIYCVPLQVRLDSDQLRHYVHSVLKVRDCDGAVSIYSVLCEGAVGRHSISANRENFIRTAAGSMPTGGDTRNKIILKLKDIASNDRHFFPLKKDSAAVTKVNVFLCDAIRSTMEAGDEGINVVASCIANLLLRSQTRIVYNDEACAWLVWCWSVRERIPYYAHIVRADDKLHKLMSDEIKGIGVIGTPGASLLVELQALLGRGVKPVIWGDEIAKRIDAYGDKGSVVVLDEKRLMDAIDAIVSYELPHVPNFPSRDEAFENRFATTKGGSHSARVRMHNIEVAPLPKRVLTKRNYVEALNVNPICKVPAGAGVSRSVKLETGKSRAIYSTDTINYLHFDSMCAAVERRWLNRKTNLKPSSDTRESDMHRRAMKLKKWKFMLDFADFNSQHTLFAQKAVTRRVFRGADKEWVDWMVDSYDNMWLVDEDGAEKRINGSLLSGHRMTSMCNTILNAAYILYSIGPTAFWQLSSEHVGDDVLITTDDDALMDSTVRTLMASPFGFLPEKQGLGDVGGEFLRQAFNENVCLGYFARSVGALVAGSWVTEAALGAAEYAESLNMSMWTLRQRSFRNDAPIPLASTLVRRLKLPINVAIKVCLGEVALNGGAVLAGKVIYGMVKLAERRDKIKTTKTVDGIRLPQHAAEDFKKISKEYAVMLAAGVTRTRLDDSMLEASYSNFSSTYDIEPVADCSQQVSFGTHILRNPYDHYSGEALQPGGGILLKLIGDSLTEAQIYRYFSLIGADPTQYLLLRMSKRTPACSALGVCYSDVRTLSTRYRAGCVITPAYPVFV